MAKAHGFSEDAARRIVEQTRRREGESISDPSGLKPDEPPVHFFRVFELTEALTAGGTADVKWLVWDTTDKAYVDSTETGEVTDTLECWTGEIGYLGRAGWLGTVDGPIWSVWFVCDQ